ncbi:MAG: hypothetical protein JSV95_02470 [Gemmatimonadota bacterium]|jgi:hypothetical protein|nr:MAG: hypothetical protein JSV95_02470 [Gemmatimonadota bacterium]
MTYEERQRYRELREELEALSAELATGDPAVPLTRAEALRLVKLIDAALEGVSPERWDNLMEVIAGEITRRVGGMAAPL